MKELKILWDIIVHTFMLLAFHDDAERMPRKPTIMLVLIGIVAMTLAGERWQWDWKVLPSLLVVPFLFAVVCWLFEAPGAAYRVMAGYFALLMFFSLLALELNLANDILSTQTLGWWMVLATLKAFFSAIAVEWKQKINKTGDNHV